MGLAREHEQNLWKRNELRTKYRKTKTYKHGIKPPNQDKRYYLPLWGRSKSEVKEIRTGPSQFSVLRSQFSDLRVWLIPSLVTAKREAQSVRNRYPRVVIFWNHGVRSE